MAQPNRKRPTLRTRCRRRRKESFRVRQRPTRIPYALPYNKRLRLEICILTGGLSTRMGRDKAQLRIGHRTMLGHVRSVAQATGLPVRVIRRDIVPRCGPLGGIYTALKRTRAAAVLFLPCDMPFIRRKFLDWFLAEQRRGPQGAGRLITSAVLRKATFLLSDGRAGFPVLLPRSAAGFVLEQIQRKRFALQALAESAGARFLRPPAQFKSNLTNINTQEEWEWALTRLSRLATGKGT